MSDVDLTVVATNQAANLGHVLEAQWAWSGHLLVNRCVGCGRELYVALASREIGGPALREACTKDSGGII